MLSTMDNFINEEEPTGYVFLGVGEDGKGDLIGILKL